MKTKLFAWILLTIMVGFILAVLLMRSAYASTGISYPDQKDYVTDTASVIDDSTEKQLDKSLGAFEKRTTNQVAVLTIQTLGDQSIEEYSIGTVAKWKLGQKGKDNGILILFSMDDHKMRIEVGRGLEGQLTDIQAQHILDDDVRPLMRSNDPSGGASKAVTDVIKAIDPSAPEASLSASASAATIGTPEDGVGATIAIFATIGIFALALLIIFLIEAHENSDMTDSYDSGGSSLSGTISDIGLGAAIGTIASSRDESDDDTSDSGSSSSSNDGGDDDGSDTSNGNGDSGDGFSGGGGGSFSGGGATSSW